MAILTLRPFTGLSRMIAQLGWSLPVYLPVGQWPRTPQEGQGGNGIREFPIPARFHFLRGLNPNQEIRGVSFGRQHNYRAFVFDNKVVVDSIGYGNAIYVFRRDRVGTWTIEVEDSKHEVWSQASSFIRKIHHIGGWQDRLLDELTRP